MAIICVDVCGGRKESEERERQDLLTKCVKKMKERLYIKWLFFLFFFFKKRLFVLC